MGQLAQALGVVLLGIALLWGALTGFAVVILGVELRCLLPFSRGVIVHVTNEGSAPVSKLAISFKGGEQTMAALAPGSTHRFRVKPSVESDVVLGFVDALGNPHSHKVDVYLNIYALGTIDITINHVGQVTWQDAITYCPI